MEFQSEEFEKNNYEISISKYHVWRDKLNYAIENFLSFYNCKKVFLDKNKISIILRGKNIDEVF